jgi:hypothetical protein
VAVIAVSARDFNAEPRLEAMACCVLLQILHELVAGHPAPEVMWNPVTRKMGERANGVQVETVIAFAPRLPHTPTLDDGGVYSVRPQCRRSGQSCGISADDHDVVHSQRVLIREAYGSRSASVRAANFTESACVTGCAELKI